MTPALGLLDRFSLQICALDQTVAKRDEELAANSRVLADQGVQIAGLTSVIAERDREIAGRLQELAERQREITELLDLAAQRDAILAERDKHILVLRAAAASQESTIQALRSSHSWRVTAPLRAASGFVARLRPGRSAAQGARVASTAASTAASAAAPVGGPEAFFTICAKNFLAHARVLHASLQPHYPDTKFYVVLCDRVDGLFDPAEEPFEFIYLDELNLPDLEAMATRYNITEFNTSVKPFAFLHLMQKYGFGSVVYLDPDLLFVDRMPELDSLLANGAEAVLTPHVLQPAENDELNDGKFLLYGIYNLGFLALRNTAVVRAFLHWWGRRLERDCLIRLEQGLFVDQRWADLLPAFVPGTRLLHHPGYNVAYWNLPQRRIERRGDQWFANGQPLRFVHFSGNNLDDPTIVSRHSRQVTMESIGDLQYLFSYYRAQVINQGHEFYRKLPYAYSWEGEHGVNLHTPKSLDKAGTSPVAPPPTPPAPAPLARAAQAGPWSRRVNLVRRAFPVALGLAGGWFPLMRRVWGAYRRNGWSYVKAKAVDLSGLRRPPVATDAGLTVGLESSNQRRLLYVDWAIPKPDIDAGSVHAVLLMKIFASLGYAVTFLPGNLKYEERYFEDLVDAGIRVVCYPAIRSVNDWLRTHAAKFDLCVLARGPVVWPYLQILKASAPHLRLIFNTVDLHYVRQLRQAEVENNDKARALAMVTRRQELDLVEHCDVTILLSDEEQYTVRKELPAASVAVVPLVFDDIPGAGNSFEGRSDILFIGSFAHEPNVDAVMYCVREILPLVQRRIPDIRFKVVGANPPQRIVDLARQSGAVDVLGFVRELQPLFEGVRLTVAPLRFGAGIKGKIGTSLCYGVPCVATPIAVEGMGLEPGTNVLVGATPEEFADAVCRCYLDASTWRRMSVNGHRFAADRFSVGAIRDRVRSLLSSVREGWPQIESATELSGFDAYQHHRNRVGDEYAARLLREQSLLPADGSSSFQTSGHCAVCRRPTRFSTSFLHATTHAPDGRLMPNWREHMQCQHCCLVNRVRAALHALHTLAAPEADSRIYMTEQVTPAFRWLQSRHARLEGSEYFGPQFAPGAMVDGIRNEDVTKLSFEDGSFDRVMSLDVFEHVVDPVAGFGEIFRVLADGGSFLLSVPFASNSPTNVVRASWQPDGSLVHHLPAEYHQNPVDPEGGALCYRYFGWEMLDQLKAAGFTRVRALAYWSQTQGYLGGEQFLFFAEKHSSKPPQANAQLEAAA